jgi:hypothetical protein
MRFIFGVLLAALCVPCGSATVQAPEMAALADVSIRRTFKLGFPIVTLGMLFGVVRIRAAHENHCHPSNRADRQ